MLIRLIYYIYNYRLLYYLPMERMNDYKKEFDLACEKIVRLEKEKKKLKKERDLYKARNEELNENCFWLSKENKNLKLIQETNEKQLKNGIKERDELREENKKLKEELENTKKRIWAIQTEL